MSDRPYAAAVLAAIVLLPNAPAFADGEIQITHAKALAGNVTPGDTAGYPVTISIPGTFQLASNLFVAANKIGIQVVSNNVTIDLNGFTMEGSNVAWYGIVGGTKAVTIKNGTITRFKFDGINGGTGYYWIVEDMRSTANGRDGIVVGYYALVRSNVATENIKLGIYTQWSSVIQGNTASLNGTYGIFTIRSTVIGNVINDNGTYGLNGGGSGYSDNALFGNDGVMLGEEATLVVPQNPNACQGACP
jgi:hypothetical protein